MTVFRLWTLGSTSQQSLRENTNRVKLRLPLFNAWREVPGISAERETEAKSSAFSELKKQNWDIGELMAAEAHRVEIQKERFCTERGRDAEI